MYTFSHGARAFGELGEALSEVHDSNPCFFGIHFVTTPNAICCNPTLQGYWIEDSKRIGLERLKNVLGFLSLQYF